MDYKAWIAKWETIHEDYENSGYLKRTAFERRMAKLNAEFGLAADSDLNIFEARIFLGDILDECGVPKSANGAGIDGRIAALPADHSIVQPR